MNTQLVPQAIDLTPYQLVPKLKVSVFVLAYNHEPYIRQSVESILAQNVDFPFEIVIGEDCSTDNTREILLELERQNPDRIRLLINETNIGMHRNVINTMRECRGQYIAFLEGDDYWTDTNKLAKQTALMDAEPGCVLSGHNVALIREDGSEGESIKHPIGSFPTRLTLKDMFGSYIQTCSMILRNGVLRELPPGTIASDKNIQVFIAQYGYVLYIDEVMAAYRLHNSSIWNPLPELTKYRASIARLKEMDEYFGFRYHRHVDKVILNYWLAITKYYISCAIDTGLVEEHFKALVDETIGKASRRHQSKAAGAYWANIAFAFHHRGSLREAGNYIARAIKVDPSLLGNRGVWSVAVKGILSSYGNRHLRHNA